MYGYAFYRDQSRPVMKAAFLDYDTVSNGDLDVSALSAASMSSGCSAPTTQKPPSACARWKSFY